MSKKDVVISVQGVSKNFVLPHERNSSIKSSAVNLFKKKNRKENTQHALKNISFDIKEGEFFGILGRNGSGKSTMLKILAEIYRPTTGKVHVKGKLVPFIELGVGFNPELTGRENVYLNGALLGFSRKEIDDRYNDIVEFAELEEFMDQKLKNYSSGMQVRLAFSVATRAEADILLVDEVLAVGDADFQRKCFMFFRSLKATGKTVVFVTHDMSAAREYCDRAILIDDGVITAEGAAGEVANSYLKLFNKSAKSERGDSPKDNRWGDGVAKIDKITSEPAEDSHVAISLRIDNKEKLDDLVLGLRIKNSQGKIVAAFNTEGIELSTYATKAAPSKLEFVITIDNIFGNDLFTLDATLRRGDGVSICDNWDNAASFSILRNVNVSESIVPSIYKIGAA